MGKRRKRKSRRRSKRRKSSGLGAILKACFFLPLYLVSISILVFGYLLQFTIILMPIGIIVVQIGDDMNKALCKM